MLIKLHRLVCHSSFLPFFLPSYSLSLSPCRGKKTFDSSYWQEFEKQPLFCLWDWTSYGIESRSAGGHIPSFEWRLNSVFLMSRNATNGGCDVTEGNLIFFSCLLPIYHRLRWGKIRGAGDEWWQFLEMAYCKRMEKWIVQSLERLCSLMLPNESSSTGLFFLFAILFPLNFEPSKIHQRMFKIQGSCFLQGILFWTC